ncbi:MAG: MazG nucleotide pyrophosphohydrolase domain-containing protein [Candidatus Helarchaeota archaeon]
MLQDEAVRSFIKAMETIETLFREDGCPWDRKQTLSSLTKYLQEESQEVVDAIEAMDMENAREELGDLLWIILMMIRVAENDGSFTFSDVLDGVIRKMINRHPHVFGDVKASSADEAVRFFNEKKQEEKLKLDDDT